MDILKAVKTVSGLVASVSAGMVVSNFVDATTPVELTKFQALSTKVGKYVVSAAIGNVVGKYVENTIQEIVDEYTAIRMKTMQKIVTTQSTPE